MICAVATRFPFLAVKGEKPEWKAPDQLLKCLAGELCKRKYNVHGDIRTQVLFDNPLWKEISDTHRTYLEAQVLLKRKELDGKCQGNYSLYRTTKVVPSQFACALTSEQQVQIGCKNVGVKLRWDVSHTMSDFVEVAETQGFALFRHGYRMLTGIDEDKLVEIQSLAERIIKGRTDPCMGETANQATLDLYGHGCLQNNHEAKLSSKPDLKRLQQMVIAIGKELAQEWGKYSKAVPSGYEVKLGCIQHLSNWGPKDGQGIQFPPPEHTWKFQQTGKYHTHSQGAGEIFEFQTSTTQGWHLDAEAKFGPFFGVNLYYPIPKERNGRGIKEASQNAAQGQSGVEVDVDLASCGCCSTESRTGKMISDSLQIPNTLLSYDQTNFFVAKSDAFQNCLEEMAEKEIASDQFGEFQKVTDLQKCIDMFKFMGPEDPGCLQPLTATPQPGDLKAIDQRLCHQGSYGAKDITHFAFYLAPTNYNPSKKRVLNGAVGKPGSRKIAKTS